jgi:hypothetical protein
MKDASNMSRTTETTGADATTAFVDWYAKDRYGSNSPENIDKAGAALNHLAVSGDTGMAQLQDHQQRFLKSGNYTWGDGKAQAEAIINTTRGEVGVRMANTQEQVMPGANTATTRTADIGTGDFSGHPADRHDPLTSSRVEGQKVLDEAEGTRDKNELDLATNTRNVAAKAIEDEIVIADGKMKAHLKEREAAGKQPLEGD